MILKKKLDLTFLTVKVTNKSLGLWVAIETK